MPVTRGGAREVITDSPALKAIQEAGDALGRMGQLFNQTRQVRAYEKQISAENADRFMAQAAGVYEKYAAATDPAQAWSEMGSMLRSGLVAYGIDAGEVENVFRKLSPLTEENINPMIVLSRALRRSMTGKGIPFEQAAGEEISTQRQEQMKEAAAATGTVGKEPASRAIPSPSPLQQEEGLHTRYGQLEAGQPVEPATPAPEGGAAPEAASPVPAAPSGTSLSLEGLRALKEAAPGLGDQVWQKIARNAEVAGGQIQTAWNDVMKQAAAGKSIVAPVAKILLMLYQSKQMSPEEIFP